MPKKLYIAEHDIHYRCTGLTHSPPSVAGRGALFYSILPKKITQNPDIDSVSKVESVLARWRTNVLRLRDAHCKETIGPGSWYLRNCMPALGHWDASSDRGQMYCQRSHLCPWCWVRSRCHGVYCTIEQAMKDLDLPLTDKDTHKKYALLLYRDTQVVDLGVFGEQQSLTYLAQLQRLATSRLGYLWQLRIQPFGGLGDAACLSIEPAPAGLLVHVTERHLALVPADFPIEGELGMSLHRPTRKQLGRALSRFASYPSGLMHWQAPVASQILNTKGRSHLLVSLGCFRPESRRRE